MTKTTKNRKKQKIGQWIIVSNDFIRKTWFICDNCEVESFEKKKQCPFCHARMT